MTPRPEDPDDTSAEGPGPEEIAARWEQIVADLSGSPGQGHDDAAWGDEGDEGWGGALTRPTAEPATDFRAWEPAEDPDEYHFVPPDPEPIGGDPMLSLSWAVLIAVPLFLLFAVVAWPTVPGLLLTAAGVAWLGALGALVWRMPHRRDDDDGPGAVV